MSKKRKRKQQAGSSSRPQASRADRTASAQDSVPEAPPSRASSGSVPVSVETSAMPRRETLSPWPVLEPRSSARLRAQAESRRELDFSRDDDEDEVPGRRTPSQISIPPVVDAEPVVDVVGADSTTLRFFEEGERASRRSLEELAALAEEDELDIERPKHQTPVAQERRTRLARYVRYTVAGAALLCVLAGGRLLTQPPSAPEIVSAATLQTATIAPEYGATAAPEVVQPQAAQPSQAAQQTQVAQPGIAAETTAPAPAVAQVEPAAEAIEGPAPSAADEKKIARAALERGRVQDAIEAAERSVDFDPTDAEAWLILGAGYLEKGRSADARKAFQSCSKEAKRGPVGECRAFLR